MSEEEEKQVTVVKNATDLQRLKLEKLMKNPEKPAFIPDRPKDKRFSDPAEFVRNVMGSSAGAGSGEFHVYRHIRRREYSRQEFLQQCKEKDDLEIDYHNKLEENKRAVEEKAAKNRAKRHRLKERQKAKRQKLREMKKKGILPPKESSSSSESEEEEEMEAEEEEKKGAEEEKKKKGAEEEEKKKGAEEEKNEEAKEKAGELLTSDIKMKKHDINNDTISDKNGDNDVEKRGKEVMKQMDSDKVEEEKD
ncbi:PRKR-interacting protein 1 homolog [Homarus americanus]|uniref:PRKR-interacting protein 1 homolog n=1 Tax=Homarus americanus TaxID=6706 RepID=UPI001C4557CB|nr:PRKR-interacting protein 1 homolog [Homarus americanus]